jgi:hypothetical protein
MKVYLEVYNNLTQSLLKEITDMGMRGCRTEWRDHMQTMDLLKEHLQAEPRSELIVLTGGDTAQQLVQQCIEVCSYAIELGIHDHVIVEGPNEPNLHGNHGGVWAEKPGELGAAWAQAYEECHDHGVRFLSPAVSGLADRDLWYVRQMLGQLPTEVGFAIHRYTEAPNLSKPYPGYESRGHEMDVIREIGHGRKIYITETGLTEGPYKKPKPFPMCFWNDNYWISEKAVANEMVNDLYFWFDNDVEAVVYYQVYDGLDESDPENNYGWTRIGGIWKPVANEMAREIPEVDPPPLPPPPPDDEAKPSDYYTLSVAADIINEVQVDSRSEKYIGIWVSVRNWNYAANMCPDGIMGTFGMTPAEMKAFARVGNDLLNEWRDHWLKQFLTVNKRAALGKTEFEDRCNVRKEYWRPFASELRRHRAEVVRMTTLAQISPERELCEFDNAAGWCVCRQKHGITG